MGTKEDLTPEDFEKARKALDDANVDKDARMWINGSGCLIISDSKGFRYLNDPTKENK